MTTGLAHSAQVRLVQHAKKLGIDPNVVLVRYASGRLLYRLSVSPHAERFVLKGALLLLVWLGETIRPTRDADLLGFGELDAESLRRLFGDVCAQLVEPDGLEFDAASMRVGLIRVEDAYGGQRPETAVAEKLHAMVVLGAANSRMRDFFDVHALASGRSFDGAALSEAIAATFARRRTGVPPETPIALTREFAGIPGKAAQWAGFTRRLLIGASPPALTVVIDSIADFAAPALLAVARGERLTGGWPPGGPWSPQRPSEAR